MQSIKLLLALLVGVGLGFFIGKSSSSTTTTSTPTATTELAKPTKPAAKASEKAPKATEDTTQATAVNDTTTDTTQTVTETPTTEVAPLPTKPTAPIASNNPAVLPRINVGISDRKISAVLTSISENLEAKKLMYSREKRLDCSGIFHQIKDSFQLRLPALRQSATYQYPSINEARSSRQIANWYYERDNFVIVEDAVKSQKSLRPGTVLFFGHSEKKYSNMTIEQLTGRNDNFSMNAIISHIAIVTEVKTDENGDVEYYRMMHARSSGKIAERFDSKKVQSRRTKGLPPFGYWQKQLVAVANIMTPVDS